ncbi:MAG: hypothetical protein HOJ21_04925 [Alphaproteobacteria bacterium]|nr:hypothetical protein [Alphaproteobacteria bacterium]
MTISFNAFLIEASARSCLVDAGDGNRRGNTLDHLQPAIKGAVLDTSNIPDLLMTSSALAE